MRKEGSQEAAHRINPIEDGQPGLVLDEVLLGHARGDAAARGHLLLHLWHRLQLRSAARAGYRGRRRATPGRGSRRRLLLQQGLQERAHIAQTEQRSWIELHVEVFVRAHPHAPVQRSRRFSPLNLQSHLAGPR
jgi:hypothetical protein